MVSRHQGKELSLLSDGIDHMNISEMPGNALAPPPLAMRGAPMGEGPTDIKGVDGAPLSSGWKHAPDGLPVPLAPTAVAPPAWPLAAGGMPQIVQVQGPRPPAVVVIQDHLQVLPNGPTLGQPVSVNSSGVPTDPHSAHPGVQVLAGVGPQLASPVLQPQLPQFVPGVQRGGNESQRVLVNAKGVQIVVKPKKPGRQQGPDGWGDMLNVPDVDMDMERDPFLPLPGAPPVTPQPPGPLGPMRREAPPGPYQRMADAQMVPAGNVIEPLLGRSQRPLQGQVRNPMQGRRSRGRPWSSSNGSFRSKRRDQA